MKRQPLFVLAVLVVWGGYQVWLSRPDHQFHLWALDIGQGDALLVQTPQDHQILLDGGPDDSVLPRLAEHMPFWDRTIELVIVSHNHADHLTGLIEVARRYQIGEVWQSGAVYDSPQFAAWTAELTARQIPTRVVSAGQQATIDGVGLQVLFPLADQTGLAPADPHDATVVIKLTTVAGDALLTGDIDEAHEQALLKQYCPPLPAGCPTLAAELLKVPHHGSRTGLLPEFLAAVAPRQAVISVGARNRYGHPAEEIIERLQAAGIEPRRTDQEGTIELELVHRAPDPD